MARSTSPVALWPILLFFLAGAAAAVLWDLRKGAPPPEAIVSAPPPRERARTKAPVRPTTKRRENPPADTDRARARPRRDPAFERVGIPSDRRESGSSPTLREERAAKILRELIESREYYGLSAGCLSTRPLGYREGTYEFEVVAADCESIARGSVIGRWRVNARTGGASYRNSAGSYEPAP